MRRSAFSLIELLFVITMVGVLAAMALPAWSKAREVGLVREAGVTLQTIRHADGSYYLDVGVYAPSLGDLMTDGHLLNDPSANSVDWNFIAEAPTPTTALLTATRQGGGQYDSDTVTLDESGNVGGDHPLLEYAEF